MPTPVRGDAGRWRGRCPVLAAALVSTGLVALIALAPRPPGNGEGSPQVTASVGETEDRETGQGATRPAQRAGAAAGRPASTPAADRGPRETVRPGDSGSTSTIRAGQRLLVPAGGFGNLAGDWRGYTVRPGDTLSTIAARFDVSSSELARLNGISDPDSLRVGQRLKLPADLSERTGPGTGSGARQPASIFPLSWPLPEMGRISSGFGWRTNPFGGRSRELHGGIDIAVRPGTPVRAAAGGVVVEAGWMGAYGYGVVIYHGRGVQTLYGHNARVLVQPGQRVERGQTIAISGSSGRSTGPHLDFRVRINGRLVNPLGYVRRP